MAAKLPWLFPFVAGVVIGCSSEPQRDEGHDEERGVEPALPAPGAAQHGPSLLDAAAADDAALASAPPEAASESGAPASDAEQRGADAEALEASVGSDASASGDASPDAPMPSAGCLAGVHAYQEPGPFRFALEEMGKVKLWVPVVSAGCRVPVLHFAGGTGATCSSYAELLEHLASHGFLVSCHEMAGTGPSSHCTTALGTAYAKHPELADAKIGSAGHHSGGAAALQCLWQAEQSWGRTRLYAGYAAEPASGQGVQPPDWRASFASITSPVFVFNGSADQLVSSSWVGDTFELLSDGTEAYWYEGQGAPHIPIPVRWMQESALVFFRWKLLGDKQACEHFKAMPRGPDWTLKGKQTETDC